MWVIFQRFVTILGLVMPLKNLGQEHHLFAIQRPKNVAVLSLIFSTAGKISCMLAA
jgi:hypothetical protein